MGASVHSCCLFHLLLSLGREQGPSSASPFGPEQGLCRLLRPSYLPPPVRTGLFPAFIFFCLIFAPDGPLLLPLSVPGPDTCCKESGIKVGELVLARSGSWPACSLGGARSPVPLSTGCLRVLDALQEQVHPLCHGPWTCRVERGCR